MRRSSTTRVLLSVLVAAVLPGGAQSQIYEPPIGIPAPDFGIEETVADIYGAGYYTHYVDSSHPQASDDDNPHGTAARPRMTIPGLLTDLPAGSVVEIHGGPYRFSKPARWTAQGTGEEPVFIRGADPRRRVQITKSRVELGGRYLIVENLELYDDSRFDINVGSPSHVAVRNCEIHGPEGAATYGSAVRARGEDIVVYDNHIHHNWRAGDLDVHGVKPGRGARRVWILDNHIHHNSGDAVQACHACDPPPRYVYIGGNLMHEDRENGVDLKYVEDTVISQNVLYGYRDASTSDGSAIVLGSDGMPNRTWVLFNEIFDSRNGIRNEETDTAWIIGNRIYDLEGFAIGLEKRAADLYIIGNTIHDVDIGIHQFWREEFRLHVFDNIFANIRSTIVNIESQGVSDASEMGNNLFWHADGSVRLRWGDGVVGYDSTSDLAGFTGGEHNLIGDPAFVDAGNFDFALRVGSAAIDAGSTQAAYDEFEAIHGVDIRVDFAGTPRPQGAGWDIGAFEHVDHTTTAFVEDRTALPTGFTLRSYPNPFNTMTTIEFGIPAPTRAVLEILAIGGGTVITLGDGRYAAGQHEAKWDGRDRVGRQAASGPYFFQLRTDERVLVRKMLLLK